MNHFFRARSISSRACSVRIILPALSTCGPNFFFLILAFSSYESRGLSNYTTLWFYPRNKWRAKHTVSISFNHTISVWWVPHNSIEFENKRHQLVRNIFRNLLPSQLWNLLDNILSFRTSSGSSRSTCGKWRMTILPFYPRLFQTIWDSTGLFDCQISRFSS